MSLFPRRLRRAAALVGAAVPLVTVAVLGAAPARAAVLFADDFEQPTRNIWLTGSGGTWSSAVEDGSTVWRQSSTGLTPTAWAGSGSGTGTTVTARVKPTSTLTGTGLVSVAGRVANPNNFYYVGLHDGALEIGLQVSRNVILASTPFAAATGQWYTLSLSFPTATTLTGTVTGPDGATATVGATDPGGPQVGDKVGFYMRGATASLDDIRLTNALPPPPPPTGPCPATINIKVTSDFGYGAGYMAWVSITNTSPAPIAAPWTVTWRFPQAQYIQNSFGSSYFQVGQKASMTSASWLGQTAPGASSGGWVVGFVASNGSATAPTDGTVNGIPCPLTFS